MLGSFLRFCNAEQISPERRAKMMESKDRTTERRADFSNFMAVDRKAKEMD